MVTDDVATTFPEASDERIEFRPIPESVRDGDVIAPDERVPPMVVLPLIEAVPVAVRFATEMLPENSPLP